MSDLISKPTRRAFQEAWVSTTLREIANDFDDANIRESDLPEGTTISGERRTLVARYYQSRLALPRTLRSRACGCRTPSHCTWGIGLEFPPRSVGVPGLSPFAHFSVLPCL